MAIDTAKRYLNFGTFMMCALGRFLQNSTKPDVNADYYLFGVRVPGLPVAGLMFAFDP